MRAQPCARARNIAHRPVGRSKRRTSSGSDSHRLSVGRIFASIRSHSWWRACSSTTIVPASRRLRSRWAQTKRSGMRERMNKAFDQFIDVDRKSDGDVADMLRGMDVDIAVDLAGHTPRRAPGDICVAAGSDPGELSRLSGNDGSRFHRLHHCRQDRAAVRPAAVLQRSHRSPAGQLSGQRFETSGCRNGPVATRGRPAGRRIGAVRLQSKLQDHAARFRPLDAVARAPRRRRPLAGAGERRGDRQSAGARRIAAASIPTA